MKVRIRKGFLWHTLAGGLLILDYFLFVTGNPSITYSLFGGWFWVPLFFAVVVTLCYAYGVAREQVNKRHFALHVFAVGVFSLSLIPASPYARQFARARLQEEIGSFVKDPSNSRADVSSEERQLMIEIGQQKHTAQFEAFIPTFRRMDYLFVKTKTGEKYRLIMTMSWSGKPVISLRRVVS
jgi:hypothetical protein